MTCINNGKIRPVSCPTEIRTPLFPTNNGIEEIKDENTIKILSLLDSDQEANKLNGIELAKGVLNLDCYDLVQLKKKRARLRRTEKDREFLLLLEFFDMFLNLWGISLYEIEMSDNMFSRTAVCNITFCNYSALGVSEKQIKINHSLGSEIINIFDSDEFLKQPYKQFLLNY